MFSQLFLFFYSFWAEGDVILFIVHQFCLAKLRKTAQKTSVKPGNQVPRV
jgi:hypothetical protein